MRCFIAIDLSQAVKEGIREVIERIRHTSGSVKWVPVENLHVTVKFLGEVSDDMAAKIGSRVSDVCMRHEPFEIIVRGTGAFPNMRRPTVLWVGIDRSDALEQLYSDTDLSLSELGFARETRRFSPHLTVGRVKDARDIEWTVKEFCTFQETLFGSIEVRELLVMQSVLRPSGAEYSRVHGCDIGTRV
jgi:2'-5' RNA ligase